MDHQDRLERQPLLSGQSSIPQHTPDSNVVESADDTRAVLGHHDDEDDLNVGTSIKDDSKLGWKTIVAIASTWIGVFLASMDSSVLATLLGTISSTYGSFEMATYFINAYMVAAALVQPLSGKLSDIYGRKVSLLIANVLFLIGNVICGIAIQDWQFILGRAVAGLGGGSLHSISTFLISDFVPLRSRGFWQGISNIAYGTGFAFGGVFGGLMNDGLGWRWAFLLQPVPIVVSIVMVLAFLPNPVPSNVPSFQRIDFLGSATLTAGLLCLLFGAVSGGNTLPWSSPIVWICFLLATLFGLAFGFIEEKVATEPVIPIRLLKDRTVLGSCLTNGCCTMGYTAMVFYLPLQMQVAGMGVAQAGLRLIPTSIGVFVGSLGTGIVMNWTGKYYILGIFCQLTLILSGILALSPLKSFSNALPFLTTSLSGSGFGGSLTITLVALISAADHDFHASLTSASYAFRTMGNVLGHTIAGAIFQDIFKDQLLRGMPDTPNARKQVEDIRRNFTRIDDLPLSLRNLVTHSYETAFYNVWIFVLTTFVVGGFAFTTIRENELTRTIRRN